MNRKLVIEQTADGSHTIYLPAIDEHYHSVNGAVQESLHVFIDAGLSRCKQKEVSVLEIGFGTGLNAYLSLLRSRQTGQVLSYTAFELYPLPSDVIKQLNHASGVEADCISLYHKLHVSGWNETVEVTPSFSLRKIASDFNQHDVLKDTDLFDLIYFDAFAPGKQAEMWSEKTFHYLYRHTRENGIIVTYCAKGAVRRMMQQAGFKVERLPGPPGKREMLRGTK